MADSLSICVVDDDRDIAEGLAEILKMVGHHVHTVFSGQDALSVLDQEDFDVAFINAELPELTDLESFMEVRRIKPDLKTVMMTGYTIEQLLGQAVRGGAVNVLQKPVTMDEVLRTLDNPNPKKIVLVAEDDPEIGDKIRDTLVLHEHRVTLAHTPEDALDSVEAGDCEILVLDLRRPVIDALEVYLELEKRDLGLPTIVVSTYPDKEDGPIDVLRDQTVTGVLIKPFDPAGLLAALETLRKKDESVPAAEPPQEWYSAQTRGGRILVIDDDRDVAEGMADVLRDLGHTVEIALTGSSALEIAQRFDAQIALVDIKLGRTSGLELIGSLEQLRPGIINVVITANAGKESVIASLRSGAFDFLNKPTHPRDLFAVLDRCFEKINARRKQQGHGPVGEPLPGLGSDAGGELRDPLDEGLGASEILGDEMLGPLGSEQYVHYAQGINAASQNLTPVIDDLLRNSQPGSSAADPETLGSQPRESEIIDSAQAGPFETPEEPTSEPESLDPDFTDAAPGEADAFDEGEPRISDALAQETEPQGIASVGPLTGGRQQGESEPDWLDRPEFRADEDPADASGSDSWIDITAEAADPVAVESETSGPSAFRSRLLEVYSQRPDIASLLAEDTASSRAAVTEPSPIGPNGPEPELDSPDSPDRQFEDPHSSELPAEAPWPEADDFATPMSGGVESGHSAPLDPDPADPSWTEPYAPEVDQIDPNWTEPYAPEVDQIEPGWSASEFRDADPYAFPDNEDDPSAPLAQYWDTPDTPAASPDPAGPEFHDLDPAPAGGYETAAAPPDMRDPDPDGPGPRQRDSDEDYRDYGDNGDNGDSGTDAQAETRDDGGRKVLKFGPFKKVI
jgi:DNA-binding NtrC family response regulator